MAWDFDRDPVIRHDDFNRLNDVAIFVGPVLDMYRTVTAEGLKSMMDSAARFTLVDVLPKESFEEGHICGAVNVPVELIERDAPKLVNEESTVVLYSCSKDCALSAVAADKFSTLGYENILRYDGGLEDWKNRGYCVEGEGGDHSHEHVKEAA